MTDRPRRGDERERERRPASRPSGSTNDARRGRATGRAARRAPVRAPFDVAARRGDDPHVAAGELHEHDRARRPLTASSSAAAVSRPSRSGSAAASTMRRTIASSASAGEMTYSPVPIVGEQAARGHGVGEIALGAQLLEDRLGAVSR